MVLNVAGEVNRIVGGENIVTVAIEAKSLMFCCLFYNGCNEREPMACPSTSSNESACSYLLLIGLKRVEIHT